MKQGAVVDRPVVRGPVVITEGPVRIADIKTGNNVRKVFNQQALKELADNIRQLGVIQPIILRKGNVLVAGERRLRAAKMAGLTEIPARVLDLDDQATLEYQAAENIHRKDLTPIEEARAFHTLTAARKYTVPQLAEVVDKSAQYVYRAIRLLELPAAIIEAIETGKLTPAHGHQILRVPAGMTEAVCKLALETKWDDDIMTAKELTRSINDRLGADITSAAFSTKECAKCVFNSGNQEQLFDGAEKGTCTNPDCFKTKTDAYWAGKVEELKAEHGTAAVFLLQYSIYDGYNHKGWIAAKKLNANQKIKPEQAVMFSMSSGEAWLGCKAKAEQSAGPAKQDPRQQEIDRAVDAAMDKKLHELMAEASEDQIVKFFRSIQNWNLDESCKELKLNRKKLEAEDCLRLAVMYIIMNDGMTTEDAVDAIGGNSKKLAAEIEKQAAAEYDKSHPAKPAKKGGK